MQLAKVLGALGRICIAAGVLILLFVAYQLWGTGLQEARSQDKLENEFESVLRGAGTTTTTTPGAPTPTAPPPPPDGDAAAHIAIPAIGVDKIVVEGVSVGDLKRGPGHYPDSPMPGQPGNAAIAGHRTTYGAPFNRVDELDPGDEILVTTRQGSFRYVVSDTQVVRPSQVEVLDDFGDNRLTLTACNPKYSARQRIVVVAKLAPNVEPAPAPPPVTTPEGQPVEPTERSLDGGLSGTRDSPWPAILLAMACAIIWFAAWFVAQRAPRGWIAYLVGSPFFFVTLFFFYESFSRLLPANF